MESGHRGLRRVASYRPYKSKQVGDTGPVESARRSNSRALGSPFSGLTGHLRCHIWTQFPKQNNQRSSPPVGVPWSKGIRHALFGNLNNVFRPLFFKMKLLSWYVTIRKNTFLILHSGLCILIIRIGDHKTEYSQLFLLFTKIPKKTHSSRKEISVQILLTVQSKTVSNAPLKGLSYEIDFKNVDENWQILA